MAISEEIGAQGDRYDRALIEQLAQLEPPPGLDAEGRLAYLLIAALDVGRKAERQLFVEWAERCKGHHWSCGIRVSPESSCTTPRLCASVL